MRDHHFALLHHRTFRVWKERHVAHFNFSKDRDTDAPPQPQLFDPPPFSRAIQAHADGTWHLPCSEPEGRWLSFRPVS